EERSTTLSRRDVLALSGTKAERSEEEEHTTPPRHERIAAVGEVFGATDRLLRKSMCVNAAPPPPKESLL
ncbi:hypothetical protein CSUI_005325, partial [Cystoisospora suis]